MSSSARTESVEVERAVGENVDFAAAERHDPIASTQRTNLLALASHRCAVHTEVSSAARVIADRVVLVAPRRGRSNHRFEGVVAVAIGRVHVEVAAQIAELDERGYRPIAREPRFRLSAAQLGRNVLHPDRRVNAGFVAAGRDLAVFEVEDAVLTYAQAAANGIFAKLDVVFADPVKCWSRLP